MKSSTETGAPAGDGAVHYRVAGGVAHLTFDRRQARNAMTFARYEALAEGLARIEADPSVRVAVLRGAGGQAFVAGTAIEQFTGFTGADGVAYEARIDATIAGLEGCRVPTVALIEGWAVGGGLAIANACDIRIAQSGARFGVPIARTLGNCLSPANLRRLTATLGQSLVARMLLLAEMPSAETLAPLGYLATVTDADALDAEVERTCARLLSHAPVTMRVTRAMLRRLAHDPRAEAPDLIAECYGSRDFAEGVEAFLAKRPAVWTGR